MSKFNVHEWNYKRRLETIDKSTLSESRVLDFFKKKLDQFKARVGSGNMATNRQLEAITEIIGLMSDLQVDGVLDQAYVDQQIKVLAPKFQQIIDNASDSFIQGTDYERSTD